MGHETDPHPLVAFDGVSVAYRAREALHGVSFRIARGERVALLGPNGAGKSTLLRALLGLVSRTDGSIRLDDQPIGALSRLEVARRVAVVPQQASLPFATRVEEVVALGRLPHEHPLRGIRPADRAASQMNQMPVVDRAVVGRVHAHGRDDHAVVELKLAEMERREHRRRIAVEVPATTANLGAGYCNLRKLSIFGGSNEIQKNIISQMIMGL